jgi:hypothetical protein
MASASSWQVSPLAASELYVRLETPVSNVGWEARGLKSSDLGCSALTSGSASLGSWSPVASARFYTLYALLIFHALIRSS